MKRLIAILLCVVLVVSFYIGPVAASVTVALGITLCAAVIAALITMGSKSISLFGGYTGYDSAFSLNLNRYYNERKSTAYSSYGAMLQNWTEKISTAGKILYYHPEVYADLLDFNSWLSSDHNISQGGTALINDVNRVGGLAFSYYDQDGVFVPGIEFDVRTSAPASTPGYVTMFILDNGVSIEAYYSSPGSCTFYYSVNGTRTKCGNFTVAGDSFFDHKVSLLYDQGVLYICDSIYRKSDGQYIRTALNELSAVITSSIVSGAVLEQSVVAIDYAPAEAVALSPAATQVVAIDVPVVAEDEDVAVGVITNAISGTLEATASVVDVADVPDVPPDGGNGDYEVHGLMSVFPFCIPFDIYNFLSVLAAERQIPHWEVPVSMGNYGTYTFVIDLTAFDSLASLLRTLELIGFCVGLAVLTRRLLWS